MPSCIKYGIARIRIASNDVCIIILYVYCMKSAAHCITLRCVALRCVALHCIHASSDRPWRRWWNPPPGPRPTATSSTPFTPPSGPHPSTPPPSPRRRRRHRPPTPTRVPTHPNREEWERRSIRDRGRLSRHSFSVRSGSESVSPEKRTRTASLPNTKISSGPRASTCRGRLRRRRVRSGLRVSRAVRVRSRALLLLAVAAAAGARVEAV